MTRAHVRTGALLVFLAVGASCSGDDAGAPTASPAAAATSEPTTTVAATTSVVPITEELPGSAPVEVSACVHPGPEVHTGTEEPTDVSLPEGDLTITRGRGDTWRLLVSDVSDPRLDGTWYVSVDEDRYTLPGGEPGPSPNAWTHRIETEEGVWQGSFVGGGIRDPETSGIEYVLVGEGAYEGLTAVMIGLDEPCPNTRGYVIEGHVPLPPVPNTGP